MLLGMNVDIDPEALASNRINHDEQDMNNDEEGEENEENDDPSDNLMQAG